MVGVRCFLCRFGRVCVGFGFLGFTWGGLAVSVFWGVVVSGRVVCGAYIALGRGYFGGVLLNGSVWRCRCWVWGFQFCGGLFGLLFGLC